MSLARAKELREQRARLVEQAREVQNRAETDDGRVMTAEERQQWDGFMKDADQLKEEVDRLERMEAAQAELSAPTDNKKPVPAGATPADGGGSLRVAGQVTSRDRDMALRAWMINGSDKQADQHMIDAARRAGVDPFAKRLTIHLDEIPLYQDALDVSHGKPRLNRDVIEAWEARSRKVREARQQAVGTGGAGGFTVGDEAIRELEIALLRFGGMRQGAQVLRTTTGADMPWPTLDDTSNEGRILGESAAATQTDLTFAQTIFGAFKYSSDMVLASVEFLQDTSISAAQVIGSALGTRIGRITNRHFTVGTGAGQPNGIVTAAAVGVTGAAGQTTTVTVEDLIDLEHSVDPDYRNNARWMFHDQTLREIKKLRDESGGSAGTGQFIWQAGLAVREPDTILGYPYIINQHVPVMAASARSIVFGDLSKYKIRDVREITLLRLDERFADNHQVAWLSFSRHDGDLVDAGTNPVKVYVNAAS